MSVEQNILKSPIFPYYLEFNLYDVIIYPNCWNQFLFPDLKDKNTSVGLVCSRFAHNDLVYLKLKLVVGISRFADLPYQYLKLLIFLSKEGLRYIMVDKVALDPENADRFYYCPPGNVERYFKIFKKNSKFTYYLIGSDPKMFIYPNYDAIIVDSSLDFIDSAPVSAQINRLSVVLDSGVYQLGFCVDFRKIDFDSISHRTSMPELANIVLPAINFFATPQN
ncbi:MAG: hypothetical protein KatS3mg090_0198 [Patescibacteria group bacterium]|nr:MAG: hypothetical protein KatS3mg090_0198 [Patescibacteria group bacterium]